MITVDVLGPVPTVHIHLRIPIPLDAGGWTWGELAGYGDALAREYAYSASECAALVNSYGRVFAETAPLGGRVCRSHRFRILAVGPVSGSTVGMREWAWVRASGTWEPEGAYTCGWRQAARAYFERTGRLIERQTFDASTGANLRMLPRQRSELPTSAQCASS